MTNTGEAYRLRLMQAMARYEAKETNPKRVIAGSGDPQQDRVDSIGAGMNAVQAKELVARAMYQLMWPTLDWPEGSTKRAKEARRGSTIAAERVLERIGQDQYQQALDACHVLMTDPTKSEDTWIDGAKTIYGLIDLVTSKVSDFRKPKAGNKTAVCETCWQTRWDNCLCETCGACLDSCCTCEEG